MADYIASIIKGIVAEVRLSPVWGWCVRHWGVSSAVLAALMLPLAFLYDSMINKPAFLIMLMSILLLLWFALTVAHGVWLVRAKLELWRSRRGGRL